MSKKHKKKFSNPPASPTKTPAQAAIPFARSNEFNPDYTYVIKDLKRIGTLAVFFLIVLLVLTFVLR